MTELSEALVSDLSAARVVEVAFALFPPP